MNCASMPAPCSVGRTMLSAIPCAPCVPPFGFTSTYTCHVARTRVCVLHPCAGTRRVARAVALPHRSIAEQPNGVLFPPGTQHYADAVQVRVLKRGLCSEALWRRALRGTRVVGDLVSGYAGGGVDGAGSSSR